MASQDELACTYAALILADDGVSVTVSIIFYSFDPQSACIASN